MADGAGEVVGGTGADAPDVEPPVEVPAGLRRWITRRKFLGIATGGAAGAGVLLHADLASALQLKVKLKIPGGGIVREVVQAVTKLVPDVVQRTLTIDMQRREDMLRLRFELYNLTPNANNPNQLVKKNANQKAYVVVHFPPQHIAEEALLRVADQPRKPKDPPTKPGDGGANEHFEYEEVARARLAGESRLAFEVPNGALPMPHTQAGLLRWTAWIPRLTETARLSNASGGPALVAPKAGTNSEVAETALEIPWRLQLSPLPTSGWLHAAAPAAGPNGVYELWHTRLGTRPFLGLTLLDPKEDLPRRVRAVWSKDKLFPPSVEKLPPNDVFDDDDAPGQDAGGGVGDGDGDERVFEPFRTSLSPRNRVEIVQNSAGFNLPVGQVDAIDVNRLMLSPLGGFIDVEGNWEDPKSRDLLLWRHRATLGRDTFVEIIERGFFMPWGFPAVRIKITERKIENRDYSDNAPSHKVNVAFLEQRIHYVILNPLMTYPASGQTNNAFDLPFRSVRSKTLITPDLTDDVNMFFGAIVPSFDGTTPDGAFRFDLEGIDWAGNKVAFRQPLAFTYFSQVVDDGGIFGGAEATSLRLTYNGGGAHGLSEDHVLRRIAINGQHVAFAAAATAGDTTLETKHMVISVNGPNAAIAPNKPEFVPVMKKANVRIESAEAISGTSLGGSDVEYPFHYVHQGGFTGPNEAETFLSILSAGALSFKKSTDTAGGVAAPSMKLTAVSRKKGAIGGDVADHKAGKFNPSSVFDLSEARLIGGLVLDQVIQAGANKLDKYVELKTTKTPDARIARLHWQPELKTDDKGILLPSRGPSQIPGKFTLDATVTNRNDGTSSTDIRGELSDVTLQLLGGGALHFIDVEIRRLVFTSRTGTSPHVDVLLGDIAFAGPLKFINELREVLSSGDGFGVDVSPAGIEAHATLGVPTIGVGIFTLSHLAFTAKIGVPFDNKPVYADFSISSKQDPFLVAVSIFGGGGWFGLRVTSEGIQAIEAGFEFGATVAVDFGIAGGSIEIMAGIYFKLEQIGSDTRVELTGYVRFHGEVHVGFVSVGLSAELDLSYVDKGSKGSVVTGRAEVTLEIPIAPDVSFEIEKSFGGDPHDPRFVDQIRPGEWLNYVDAFADEGEAL